MTATPIKRGVRVKIANGHLQEVGSLLSEIDPKLTETALETPSEDNGNGKSDNNKYNNNDHNDDATASAPTSTSADEPMKRKSNEFSVPRKKSKIAATGEENLTLTQQEDKGMISLMEYIEECGGEQLFFAIRQMPHLYVFEFTRGWGLVTIPYYHPYQSLNMYAIYLAPTL